MGEKEVILDDGNTFPMSPKLADHISERYEEYRKANS
jgi:hypothetical protein